MCAGSGLQRYVQVLGFHLPCCPDVPTDLVAAEHGHEERQAGDAAHTQHVCREPQAAGNRIALHHPLQGGSCCTFCPASMQYSHLCCTFRVVVVLMELLHVP